jgi:hypothetical protein
MRKRSVLPAGVLTAVSLGVFWADSSSARAAGRAPRVELTDPVVRPSNALRVWVACPTGTGAADVQSAVTKYTGLEAQPTAPWWFAAPQIRAGARSGVYELHARCTPGPGAPYSAATAVFRVSTAPQRWAAESTTAQAITGDARFTPESLAFRAGGALHIRYVREVPAGISVLGSSVQRAHAQLFAVLSPSDLRLRAGNRLCGERPTYITILRTTAALTADIIVTVYSGSREPTGAVSDAICASYTYVPEPA